MEATAGFPASSSVSMTARAGATPRLITSVAISRGRFGKLNGRRMQWGITRLSSAPLTAKATCRNLKKTAVGSPGSPDFIKLSCTSRRESRSATATSSYGLCNLRGVLNSVDGEGDHCWKRLRRIDGGYLRGAREPESAGPGGSAARWAALDYHIGGKLSRLPGRNRRAGAHPQHA